MSSTLSKDERRALIEAAIAKTKTEFASEVSARTVLTSEEVLKLAKTQQEREALAKAIAEVKSDTASNEKKAKAIREIKGGVESLVRIVDLLL